MIIMFFNLNILVYGCYFNEAEITLGPNEVKMLVVLF